MSEKKLERRDTFEMNEVLISMFVLQNILRASLKTDYFNPNQFS